jgi:ketosteroid isomerase-like protein
VIFPATAAKVLLQYFRLFYFKEQLPLIIFTCMNKHLRIASLLICFIASLLIFSCRFKSRKENPEDAMVSSKIEMMNTDRQFSVMSEKEGLRNAYTEFIDSNGVLLRPGSLPMTGGDAMDFITQSNDTSFTMTWEPKNATLSSSGDLGYTYGVYSLKRKDADTIIYGSYVTIWKRQPNGKWKFVLQSGNEGVE